MRPTVILNLLLLLTIGINSCKKSDDLPGYKVYVPAYLKAMAPYTNGQSVSFSNGSGQTVTATVSITSKFSLSGICGSCTNQPNNEIITYSLKVGSYRFIEFVITPDTYIGLSIYSPVDNYQSGSSFDFSVDAGVSHGSCFAQRQVCLPSITLNGKTFTEVLEITALAFPSQNLVKAYHTVSQGVVGFKYTNGTTYNLE